MRLLLSVTVAAVLSVLLCSGCGRRGPKSGRPQPRLVVVMLDETGSYVKDLGLWEPSRDLACSIIGALQPGDAFCLIGMDATPYEAQDVRLELTSLPTSTLAAAVKRRELQKRVEKLEPRESVGKGTPVTLAVAHAADLISTQEGRYRPYLVIFSDMSEDPPEDGQTPKDVRSPIRLPAECEVRALYVSEFGGREEFLRRTGHWEDAFRLWGVTRPVAIHGYANSGQAARDFIHYISMPG